MNQDIYLGGGWDKINILNLHLNKLIYPLTRRLPKQWCPCTASCYEKPEYVGSHDVFVFYAAANFIMEMIMGLDFEQNWARKKKCIKVVFWKEYVLSFIESLWNSVCIS